MRSSALSRLPSLPPTRTSAPQDTTAPAGEKHPVTPASPLSPRGGRDSPRPGEEAASSRSPRRLHPSLGARGRGRPGAAAIGASPRRLAAPRQPRAPRVCRAGRARARQSARLRVAGAPSAEAARARA